MQQGCGILNRVGGQGDAGDGFDIQHVVAPGDGPRAQGNQLLGGLQGEHGIFDIVEKYSEALMIYPANDPVLDGGAFKPLGQLADDRANCFAAIGFAYSGKAIDPDFNESCTQGLGAGLGNFRIDITKQGFMIRKAGILVIARELLQMLAQGTQFVRFFVALQGVGMNHL